MVLMKFHIRPTSVVAIHTVGGEGEGRDGRAERRGL